MTTPSGRIPLGDDDDHDEWMAIFHSLPDREIDDLLAGRPTSSEAAASLAELVEVLRADARRAGAPAMSAALRGQVAGPSVARPPRRRRRALVGSVVGLVLGASAVGAAAAQNALPGPLQDAASSAGSVIGIELPRTEERDSDGDDGPDAPGSEGTAGERGSGSGTSQDDPGPAGHEPPTAPQGPPDTTPAATPADPGTPGDREPATPATPADREPATPTTSTPPTTPVTGGGNGQSTGGNGRQDNGADPRAPQAPGDPEDD